MILRIQIRPFIISFYSRPKSAGGDPFGDDMDDHFDYNGGNLVNLVEEGAEKLPTEVPPTTSTTTTTSTLIDEDVVTTVDDADVEQTTTTTTTMAANLLENNSASANETSPLEKEFESVSFDPVNASQAENGKGVSSQLVETGNVRFAVA